MESGISKLSQAEKPLVGFQIWTFIFQVQARDELLTKHTQYRENVSYILRLFSTG